jgi:hypothetical protein
MPFGGARGTPRPAMGVESLERVLEAVGVKLPDRHRAVLWGIVLVVTLGVSAGLAAV